MEERTLIDTIKKEFDTSCQGLIKGIGDDCAVFSETDGKCWLISTDLLVENSHFILEWHTPFLLGRKSIAVNLSDVAAMGGSPRFILLSLEIPHYLTSDWLAEFRHGVRSILQEFDCHLIGGDITGGKHLTISVTIIGSAQTNQVIYRSGAIAGQDIFVTGHLGSSAAGLNLLQKGYGLEGEYHQLIHAHLDPKPQVQAGVALAQSQLVGAMQDISDGLSTDISHICQESGVGALLYEKDLPYTPQLAEVCDKFTFNRNNIILRGGEDYQLIFTSDHSERTRIFNIAKKLGQTFYRVGTIRQEPKVYLHSANDQCIDVTFQGFEHKTI